MEKLPFVTINQPMKIFKSKSSPGFCTICNDENEILRNMEEDHTFKGEIENYTKMMLKCFNIKIYHFQGEEKFNVCICERCVSRLKEAYHFRKQVEAVDESLGRRTRSSESPNTMMQIIVNKYSNESGRDDRLRRILLKKRIKSEILEKLKISNETRFSNCLIRKKSRDEKIHKKLNRLEKSKKKKEKKKSKLKKNRLFKSYEIEHHIKTDPDDLLENAFDGDFDALFQQSSEDESNDSAEIKTSTGFVKQDPIVAKKEIFLIPALENSAKFCPICEMVPNSRQSLLRHYYDTHFPSFLCHLCGYGTTLRDSFTGHMKTHRGVKYSCSSCSKTFFSPISRYHHEKAIHKKIPLFSCTMCKATFSHSVTRRKHMFEKHGVECAKHACGECGKVFYSGHRLSVHVKRSHLQHRPFSCSVCGYSFFQNCDLRDHMTKHTGAKDFNCDQCGKCFSRRACLMEHLKIHANIRNFRCQLCDKTFVQKVSLKGHMKTHERNLNINKSTTEPLDR